MLKLINVDYSEILEKTLTNIILLIFCFFCFYNVYFYGSIFFAVIGFSLFISIISKNKTTKDIFLYFSIFVSILIFNYEIILVFYNLIFESNNTSFIVKIGNGILIIFINIISGYYLIFTFNKLKNDLKKVFYEFTRHPSLDEFR